jgi:hypothetical protein
MPSPVHIQKRKTATASAFQLKKNNEANAPRWKRPKAMLFVQLITLFTSYQGFGLPTVMVM